MTPDLVAWIATPTLAFSLVPLLKGFVMTLFVLSAIVLILVILVQEGKGGGIAGAFGGAAAETFGVKAGSVNRFTAIVATVFVGLALLHAGLSSAAGSSVIQPTRPIAAPPEPAPEPPATPPSPEAPAMTDTPPAMTDTPPAMTETPPGMDAPPPPPPTPAPDMK